jgi:hypothetical protein
MLRARNASLLLPLAAVALALLWTSGCDVVEQKTENRQFAGTYVAQDSLVLRFTPGNDYDEEDELFNLPDTSFRLLERQAGNLRVTLENTDSDPANKGTVSGRLTISDSITIPSAQTFLVPAADDDQRARRTYFKLIREGTLTRFDPDSSDYVGIVDRVSISPDFTYLADDTSSVLYVPEGRPKLPIPTRWTYDPERGTLSGSGGTPVRRTFKEQIGLTRKDTTRTLGTLSISTTLHRQ